MNPVSRSRSLLLPALFALPALFVVSPAIAQDSPWRNSSLKIIQTTEPEYPPNMETLLQRRGEVRLVINVDADGHLVDWLVTSYTHPAFATAAVDALKEWRYEPARIAGEPVGTRAALVLNFQVKGQVISLNSIDAIASQFSSALGERRTDRVCLPHELDQPVQALQTVPPRAIASRTQKGSRTVVVDFYIDETGRPRMPVVTDAQDQQAAAAVDALMQWRYTVPTKAGEPVAVRARQSFVFTKNS
jgi:TonB family protein